MKNIKDRLAILIPQSRVTSQKKKYQLGPPVIVKVYQCTPVASNTNVRCCFMSVFSNDCTNVVPLQILNGSVTSILSPTAQSTKYFWPAPSVWIITANPVSCPFAARVHFAKLGSPDTC